jgi:hypothetical protein
MMPSERKTDGEQLEIFRRRHHHHMRDAVVNERNGHFFGQKIGYGMGYVGRSVYRQFHNAGRQGDEWGSRFCLDTAVFLNNHGSERAIAA